MTVRINPNITRSWDKAQGTTHPSDLSYQIIRDYNIRYVSIQNSSMRSLGVGITSYYGGQTPEILLVLRPGEIRHLGINSIGEAMQFLWPISLETGMIAGKPCPFQTNAVDFVLRDGVNSVWVQPFRRGSFAAAK